MFKVGDLIEGKRSASEEYTITKEGGVYKVVNVHVKYEEVITVEVECFPTEAESRNKGPFEVNSKHFQLIDLNLINE